MSRYYGQRIWHYRYCGSASDWPGEHQRAGDIDLGTNAGYGLKVDEQQARFLLRKLLGVKRLPPKTEVYPGVR